MITTAIIPIETYFIFTLLASPEGRAQGRLEK
jgi:hypothetical protein